MTWEVALMLCLLAAMGVLFVTEKIAAELTAMITFAATLLFGLLPPERAMSVFANEGPIAIGALFIISSALEKCGAIEMAALTLQRLPKVGLMVVIPVMVAFVGLISAFINNTAVVFVFLPVVVHLAKNMGTSASMLLIPLSYASMLGGSCTLVGTSTNIIVSSMAKSEGIAPFGMFELGVVGLPLFAIGALYLTFFGPRLLPDRKTMADSYGENGDREYIAEAYVKRDSELEGKPLSETNLYDIESARVLEVHRHGVSKRSNLRDLKLEVGDRIMLAMSPKAVPEAQSEDGIDLRGALGEGLEEITQAQGIVVEGVVGPDSRATGRTLGSLDFLERYGLVPLGLNRREQSLQENIDEVALERGDTILLLGTADAVEKLRSSDDILVLDKPTVVMPARRKKLPLILGVIAAVIGAAASGVMPIAPAAVVGSVALIATKCITLKGAYESIHWPILFLIFSMLGIGAAMESTGASAFLGNGLVGAITGAVPAEWQPLALLAGIYLLTTVLTEALSNNAAAVLVASLAIGLAQSVSLDPRPFLIAIALAASASFATPIGYQTNTYVYGVGGYRFGDFFKVGVPLNVIAFSVAMVVIPLYWPF